MPARYTGPTEGHPEHYRGVTIYAPTKAMRSFRLTWVEPDGTRRQSSAKTIDAARDRADDIAMYVESGQGVAAGEFTVRELATRYLHDLAEEDTGRRYRDRQESLIRLWVLGGHPEAKGIPDVKMMDWQPSHNRAVLNAMRDAGRSAEYVKNCGSAIKGMVSKAHELGWVLLNRNPMNKVKYATRSGVHGQTVDFVPRESLPTHDDVAAIIRGFEQSDLPGSSRLAIGVDLTRFSAVRFGELIALRPCDIDLNKRIVHVQHSIAQYDDGTLEMVRPKNNKTRTTFFPPSLTDRLGQLCEMVEVVHGPEGLLFPKDEAGTQIDRQFFRRRWSRAAKLAGWTPIGGNEQWPTFAWTLHDLRHAAACWMLYDLKMELSDVSFHLGHFSETFTMARYIGVRGDANERARALSETW